MEFYLTIRADKTLLALATRLINLGQQILKKEAVLMSSVQDVIDEVATETTVIAGLQTFISGLQNQIAGLGVPPAQQAQIDQIFGSVSANVASLNAALAINTPPTPTPVAVPPVSS